MEVYGRSCVLKFSTFNGVFNSVIVLLSDLKFAFFIEVLVFKMLINFACIFFYVRSSSGSAFIRFSCNIFASFWKLIYCTLSLSERLFLWKIFLPRKIHTGRQADRQTDRQCKKWFAWEQCKNIGTDMKAIWRVVSAHTSASSLQVVKKVLLFEGR